MTISQGKLAVIHVAKKQLHLSDKSYRSLLYQTSRVRSAKDLGHAGFVQVMQRFEKLGFKSDYNKHDYGQRPGMATLSQLKYIRSLWRQYASYPSERNLNKWLERQFHVSSLRFVDQETAAKVIVTLKRMAG